MDGKIVWGCCFVYIIFFIYEDLFEVVLVEDWLECGFYSIVVGVDDCGWYFGDCLLSVGSGGNFGEIVELWLFKKRERKKVSCVSGG